jgi:hypothetical protein
VKESSRLRLAGHKACMRTVRVAYVTLVGMPERNKVLMRTRGRWQDDIKMDLIEVGYETVDSILHAQDRKQRNSKWRAVV